MVDAPASPSEPLWMSLLGGSEALAFNSASGTLASGLAGSAEAVLEDRRALMRRDGAPMRFNGASVRFPRRPAAHIDIFHARTPGDEARYAGAAVPDGNVASVESTSSIPDSPRSFRAPAALRPNYRPFA